MPPPAVPSVSQKRKHTPSPFGMILSRNVRPVTATTQRLALVLSEDEGAANTADQADDSDDDSWGAEDEGEDKMTDETADGSEEMPPGGGAQPNRSANLSKSLPGAIKWAFVGSVGLA